MSFASRIGATLAFLAARFLLRDCVQATLRRRSSQPINEGVAKEGAFYLFTLRLVPVFPFFVINLLMGLTPMQRLDLLLGQPARHARRHDGLRERRHAARADRVARAASCRPALIGAFVLLGVFPLIAKKVVDALQGAQGLRALARGRARFDRNLVVIGAGSAGLVSAYIAAAVKAKVTLVEKHRWAATA